MIKKLRAAISKQLSHPSGAGGRLIAAAMNRGNKALNARAIELLDVTPQSRVLDLGFGGGLTLPDLLERAAAVVGVDRAADMVEAAKARHPAAEFHTGVAESLPLADGSVDRVLSVNTVYFWPDLPKAFGELRRVLSADGRLVLGIRDGSVMEQVNRDVFTVRPTGELLDALRAAGFTEVELVSAPDGKTHLLTGVSPA